MNKNLLCIVVCVLAILLLTVLDSRGQGYTLRNAAFVGAAGFSAASVASCTPSQGNLLADEGFETTTTGYERSGWGTATGSPDPYYSSSSATTSKPTGACDRAFRSNYNGTYRFNYWSAGAYSAATVYVRVYLYVRTNNIGSGESSRICGIFSEDVVATGYSIGSLFLDKSGSQLRINAVGAGISTPVNISAGTWYLVELKVLPGGSSAFKVNGGSEQTFTANGGTWRAVGIGAYSDSNSPNNTSDILFDLLAVDSTGYVGAVP